MTINKLIQIRKGKNEKRIPLPTVSDVLYAHPNPDSSIKKCGNCWMWCMDKRCLIVEGEIHEGQNCGYHVYGTPRPKWYDVGADMITQELAGLTFTEDGTSCSSCIYFTPRNTCLAVTDDKKPASIEPLGCCTRWDDGKNG